MILSIASFAGLSTLCVVYAAFLLFGAEGYMNSKKAFRARLDALSKTDLGESKTVPKELLKRNRLSAINAFHNFLVRHVVFQRLARLIGLTNLKISVFTFFGLSLLLGFLGYHTFRHFVPLVLSGLLAIFFAILPYLGLIWNKRVYMEKFLRSFPGTLSIIARSMRVGHSFNSALEIVGKDAPYPVNLEFSQVASEVQLGIHIEEALNGLKRRLQLQEIKIFCTAVSIHQQVGGNLSELLSKLECTLRNRHQLVREIKSLSAQGRLTSRILLIGPFVVMFAWALYEKTVFTDYVQSSFGRSLIYCSLACQIIGFLWSRQVCRITD